MLPNIDVFKKTMLSKGYTFIELLFYLAFLTALTLKCFYFQFTTRLNIPPFSHVLNVKMVISTIGVILIIASFIFLLFNKKRLWVLLIVNIILSTVIIADTLYFRYYNNPITIPVLQQIGLVGPLGDSITNLIRQKDIIFVLDLPFLLAGALILKRDRLLGFNKLKRLVIFMALFLIGVASFGVVYANTHKDIFSFDKNYIAVRLGILYYHAEDTKSFIKENILTSRSVSQEERAAIDEFFSSREPQGTDFNGFARGKSIIMVQSEALQEFLINKTIEGKEITPNLNSLIKDSLYFDNFYFQAAGGKTSDAEFLANTSLYPLKEGAVYFRYPSNTYLSLPNLLKAQGYTSASYHAYDPSYWNRSTAYRAIGFDAFYSRDDFEPGEKTGWGLSDAGMFTQALDKTDTSKPFYSFLVTLSCHYPFDDYENYDFDVGEFEGTFLGNYIKGQNYADACIGILIEQLKARGLYDDTLLLLYGDHYGIPRLEGGNDLMKFMGVKNNSFEWAKLQKVPFIIHYPGLKNGQTDNTVSGQIDILPTIANLMGFEAPFAMGKDLLNTDKGYAVLRNSSVITDRYIYWSKDETIYDIQTGQPAEHGRYDDELEQYQDQLKISDIIIQKNAFK
ncbi:phosphoglycerol transferase MdoB-like AlkP superfamily enzyme [Anaerobacterium chartisolvens]|uniref:Phosphoglycerol transferase MdoB-like AlkP superfamily enzyme n=1 Tax=Anaerobacterium chartisolvens TaxID=1297424 RepID=A0A369B1P9_9FIRM|nr:LTA synthase family protein [Anaerobacterium chartisolvens]RCX15479.1 phosphoglycerol transferase MdoB-like AlkP superfamily enzyme [Anaerobacterium chartisolvens]